MSAMARESNYLQPNWPPYGGKCTVEPMSGIVLTTEFKYQCDGWSDDDNSIEEARYSITGSFCSHYILRTNCTDTDENGNSLFITQGFAKYGLVSFGTAGTHELTFMVVDPENAESKPVTISGIEV